MEIAIDYRDENGFTLIELLIAMVILGVVLTGVVKMFSATGGYHTGQEMIVDLTQNLRAVKQLMVGELRSASCDPMNIGTFGFKVNADDQYDTDDNSIHFTRDIDDSNTSDRYLQPDGKVGANEDISYYRTDDDCVGTTGSVMASGDNRPGCLRRNTGGGGQSLLPWVTQFLVRYYDQNDTELTGSNLSTLGKLEKIDSVRVIIQAQVEHPSKVSSGTRTQQLDFRVLIRNR